MGTAPLPAAVWASAWSRDGELVAYQPSVACGPGCEKADPAHRILITRRRVARGRTVATDAALGGWTPRGQLVLTPQRLLTAPGGPRYYALDLATKRRTPVSPVPLGGPPLWSADGRYIAARVAAPARSNTRVSGALLLADARGRPLQTITSPYVISMFTWSPRGHRLAYTTSGFPDPHQLFVVDRPGSRPRLVFATGARHFDWVTWSPDARTLLLDDEHARTWRLLPAARGAQPATRARRGGRPIWCCPVGPYAAG